MKSNLNNNDDDIGNTTAGLDQALHNNPASATSNQQHIMSGFSTAMSPAELQSSYPAIDPWFLYGGNIAAACQATNAVVEVHQRTRDDTKTVDDGDKQKQRANSRLTAWQSRERKRIEFEVLQEREAELKSRNMEMLQENQQLKMIIGSFKSNAMPTRDNSATNEPPHDCDVMREPQKGVPTSSASQTSRQISRNFEDIHQQFGLPFQNRTALTIPEPRGNRDFMFSLEPDPMTGVASFPSTMEYSSTRDANRRMMSSSTNDDGTSLTGGTSQHVRGDMGGYSTMGMNSVSGSTAGNFLYNSNDMLAPTIFAPLFRGDSNQEQSAIATANSHGNERVGQNSNRHLLFGSSLPFLSSFSGQGAGSCNFAANLSNYLTASLAEEKVDVPLFRAIRTARSSQSNHSQQPQAPKRKRSVQQGKDDEGRIPEHEDAAGSSDYTAKNAYPRLSSTTRENVGVTESKAYPSSGIHGSELLFSGDNVDETPPFSLGDTLVASLSNSNVYNDDGDES